METSSEIYSALKSYAKTNPCFRRILKKLKIKKISHPIIYRYNLETFEENRILFNNKFLYDSTPNEEIHSLSDGTIWSIAASLPTPFTCADKEYRISAPESVSCQSCDEGGDVSCVNCGGLGRSHCYSCCGLGYRSVYTTGFNGQSQFVCQSCPFCLGGRTHCFICSGTGAVICPDCEGDKVLQFWRSVRMKWEVNREVHHITRGIDDLESKLMEAKTTGITFLYRSRDAQPISGVTPVTIGDPELVDVTRNWIGQKIVSCQNGDSRVLQFQESFEVIPVTRVEFEHGKEFGHFIFMELRKLYISQKGIQQIPVVFVKVCVP